MWAIKNVRHSSTYEYASVIKHLLCCAVGSGPRWETLCTIIRAITATCVCVWVKLCVCFLLWQGGAGWTNMSFWVSGCRANIDQSALRHVAGQIKHSSGTKSQWHTLSPGWISLRLSDWPATHHTHQERHRLLQMVLYFKRYSLPFVDVYFSFFSSSC